MKENKVKAYFKICFLNYNIALPKFESENTK